MKYIRRFFSLFLALILLGSLALPAAGADEGKVTIATVQDFLQFVKDCTRDTWSLDRTVELTADLDLSGTDVSPVPIFQGTFHGNGHTISGLSLDQEGSKSGLFRTLTQSALVEDLLFLAKSDAGKETSPVTAPVDVSELTWSALLPFEPVAFEQGVEMESEIADQLTVQGNADQLTVQGNADQLRRLVAILLDNAVKYAGNGGRVKLVLSRPERGGVCLTVHNTGPAIPPEHLPHLFERFYRADDSRARTSGGYGLGLAIAKRIVDGHGGSITVSSREDASTDFTVRLPHSQ